MQTIERPGMAKKQKTFFLNTDLERLIAAEETRTGANFTRITTAALLRYLFSDLLDIENAMWMQLAGAVEKNNLDLGSVPERAFRTLHNLALEDKKRARESGDDAAVAIAQAELERVSSAAQQWAAIVDGSTNPIDAFVAHKTGEHVGQGVVTPVEQIKVTRWMLRNAKNHGGTPEEIASLEREIAELEQQIKGQESED